MLIAQLVEDHHMILPYWFEARERYRGCVLVHLDEHLDYMRRPAGERQALLQARERLHEVQGDIHLLQHGLYGVEDFLSSVTLLGIFARIVWVKPLQTSPVRGGLREHFSHFDWIAADELSLSERHEQGLRLSDMELLLVDCESRESLPEAGSRVVIDIDLDFADKASPQDLDFALALLARLRRAHEVVGVTLCRSVNGGYLDAGRAGRFLEQIVRTLGLAGVEPLATNYRLPERLNRGLRLIREHRFAEAAPMFSQRIEGVADAVVAHYLGHAHQLAGDSRQAWHAWNIALSLDPRQWLTRVQAGFLLAASPIRADHETAHTVLAAALQERPESYRLNLVLAQLALLKLQEPELAQGYFETARRVRPLSPEVAQLSAQFSP